MNRRSTDLGMVAVDRIHREMQIDEPWTLREERGFTWWGAWIRQRVWSGEAVRSRGETLWHVRAVTPTFRDLPDEPATYAQVADMNLLQPMSAFVYDPGDGTISARCGALVYDGVAPWISTWLLMASGLQASMAWMAGGSEVAEDLVRDDAPHPSAGPRRDPDDMLNVARTLPDVPSRLTASGLEAIATELAGEGIVAAWDTDSDTLHVLCPMGSGQNAIWHLRSADHPVLGAGAVISLTLPTPVGPLRGAWLANALNAAESAEWRGEDRPHAFGAWKHERGGLYHDAFLPAVLLGRDADDLGVLVRNLVYMGTMRAGFAGERLPWLDAAAAARYPDDEPVPPGDGDTVHDHDEAEQAPEPIDWNKRTFGPAARAPRPRAASPVGSVARELIVDPADPSAFGEIDDAVAAAEDGDRILVRPGTYRKPVVIDRAVRIDGDGDATAVILEPVGGEALGFAVSGASVTGLTIRPARVGNDGDNWSAVAVHNVEATVEGCLLSTHLGATIWVGGASSNALILGCAITGGAQNGVWVCEEGRARVVASRIAGHRWPVTAGGEHSVLEITDSEIVDNLDDGVGAMDGALLVIEGSTVAGNAGTGILLGAAAPSSRIEDCTVERNSGHGIMVGAVRGCSVLRNRIRDNGAGIVVVAGASPHVVGNEFTGNGTGIGVRGRGSDPVVIGNTVAGARFGGVVIDEAAGGRYEGNTVTGAGHAGVWVDDEGSAPTFSANEITRSAGAGVLVTDGAGGHYSSNDLRGNAEGSWMLDEPGDLERTGNLEDTGRTRPDAPGPSSGMPARLN